jgi:hypothetical protein
LDAQGSSSNNEEHLEYERSIEAMQMELRKWSTQASNAAGTSEEEERLADAAGAGEDISGDQDSAATDAKASKEGEHVHLNQGEAATRSTEVASADPVEERRMDVDDTLSAKGHRSTRANAASTKKPLSAMKMSALSTMTGSEQVTPNLDEWLNPEYLASPNTPTPLSRAAASASSAGRRGYRGRGTHSSGTKRGQK